MDRQTQLALAREGKLHKVNAPLSVSTQTLAQINSNLERIEGYEYYDSLFVQLHELGEKMEHCHIGPDASGWYWFTWYTGVKKLSDLKPFLKAFATMGWRRDGSTKLPKDGNTAIEYNFKHPWYPKAKLEFKTDFKTNNEDPDACHMVQTGVEIKEVPVYKLVCPEPALKEET